MKWEKQTGFTIVELLIVVVVIAILAAITIVAYNGMQRQAQNSATMSEVASAAKQLKADFSLNGAYPATPAAANDGKGLRFNANSVVRYRANNATNPATACLTVINGKSMYYATESVGATEGSCYNLVTGTGAPAALSDNNTHHTPYHSGVVGLTSVTIDLGSLQDVSRVQVWHYWSDSRTYYQTKTEVSEDGTNWTAIFDSATQGTYPETSQGRTYDFPMQKVRYVRDWINGNSTNTGNHWSEIKVF